MAEGKIVITGANSPLAQALIEKFSPALTSRLVGLVSPRSDPATLNTKIGYFRADLERQLPEDAAGVLKEAEAVLHMAWIRDTDPEAATHRNMRIAERLVAAIGSAGKFHLLSTISAGPDAPGAYGRAKFAVGEWLNSQGGGVLVCGLVVSEPPISAFKMLCDVSARVPFAIRFWAGRTQIYPIGLNDLAATLEEILLTKPGSGTAALFLPGGVPANQFMKRIEAKHPRTRLPVWLPNKPLLAVAKLGRNLPLKDLSEKVVTFLYTDERWLGTLTPPAGASLEETRAALRGDG